MCGVADAFLWLLLHVSRTACLPSCHDATVNSAHGPLPTPFLLSFPPPPGIINGGVVSSLFDCHGNWTAAIALMDKAALPKPPLTLTYEMLVRPACLGLASSLGA